MTMILADTSVWIDHFRKGNERLSRLLNEGQVLSHPFVIGELACGNLRNRKKILGMLSALPCVQVADHDEVIHFLAKHRIQGQGVGWIDAHLLASSFLTRCRLWTLDESLAVIARTLRIDV